MNWKTATFVVVGVVGIGIIAAGATEPSPRKGLGHGDCIGEACQNRQQEQVRDRQYRNRDKGMGETENRERRRRGHGRGEGKGLGSGEGEFRQDQGQGHGWHRDQSGVRKPEAK